LEQPSSSPGYGGSQAFREAMDVNMRMAMAQARHITPDGADIKLPSFALSWDVWPPHFRAGSRVEFDPLPLESVRLADFVVVQSNRGPAIRRFVRWAYDGDRVSMVVLTRPRSKEVETLPGGAFLGVVAFVVLDEKIAEPNKRSHLERVRAFLTGGGTSGPFKEFHELVRDVLLVLQNRKSDKPKTKSFFQSLRELREYHRQCEEEEARRKAESLAALQEARSLGGAGLSLGIEPTVPKTRGPRSSAGR